MAVRETVGRLIADVYAGKLQSRIAAGLAPLMNLQPRAIETVDLEQKMVRIENLLARAEAEGVPEDALQGTGGAPRLDPEEGEWLH
jgi:hypothetical protein